MSSSNDKRAQLSEQMKRDCKNPQKVQALLLAGADINYQDEDGVTVLMSACVHGYTATVDFLLRHGADPNLAQQGMTALMKAAFWKQPYIVRQLVKAGANVNAKGSTGATALHYAATAGLLETAEILVDAGIDINARNSEGATALDYAREKRDEKIIAFLESRGAV